MVFEYSSLPRERKIYVYGGKTQRETETWYLQAHHLGTYLDPKLSSIRQTAVVGSIVLSKKSGPSITVFLAGLHVYLPNPVA